MRFRSRFNSCGSAAAVERDFHALPDYGDTNTDQSSYRPDIVRVSMPSASRPVAGSFDVGSDFEGFSALLRPGLDPTERASIADSLQQSVIDDVKSRFGKTVQDKTVQDKTVQDKTVQDKA